MKARLVLLLFCFFAAEARSESLQHNIDSINVLQLKGSDSLLCEIYWKSKPSHIYLFITEGTAHQITDFSSQGFTLRADLSLHPLIDEIAQLDAIQKAKPYLPSKWMSQFVVDKEFKKRVYLKQTTGDAFVSWDDLENKYKH